MVPVGDSGPALGALVRAVHDAPLRARLREGGRATAGRYTWAAARRGPRARCTGGSLARDDGYRYAVWTAEWKGGLRTDVSGRGHALRSDEPPEFGGTDTRPHADRDPVRLRWPRASAWLWCGRRGSGASSWPTSRCRSSPTGPSASRATASYDVWVHSSVAAEILAPAVDLAKRYCWVTNTLTRPPEIRYHLGAERRRRSAVTRSTSSGIW